MVMDMGSISMENLANMGSMVGMVLASLGMESLARNGNDSEDNIYNSICNFEHELLYE